MLRVRAFRRFITQPVMPEQLQGLGRLALNLRWSWHNETRELLRAVDPVLWDAVDQDPRAMLSRVDPERLQNLAKDRRFVRNVQRLSDDLDEYLTTELWYQRHRAENPEAPEAIGYFSAEFGVADVLPQYSGGLGILAGDHLKAASDLGVPIIGVGLMYRHGYFRQSLNADGYQQERYPLLDPNALPLTLLTEAGEPVVIDVPLYDHPLYARIWVAQVGRVPLLMMDTDLDVNSAADRQITDRLYGGGAEHRMAQEVLLGIGGVRALRAYCRVTKTPTPSVYHANEGHAGFLGLERIREYMNDGDEYATAVERTRAGNVFTTHTPVPAGIDRFPREMVSHQFASFGPLPLDRVLALGSEDYEGGDPSRFNMAVMGFRLGQRANGVSRLHGEVSRDMFQGLWPGFDTSEVPIGSITNGVHHRTWMHPELLELLETPTGDFEHILDGYDWSALDRVDPDTIWSLKRSMRADLVQMARERLRKSHSDRGLTGSTEWINGALDPSVLTLGFARRGASYKRLTLMLSDVARLKAMLNHPERPIQIVIAGKSHPADEIGKSLIQQMVLFADDPEVRQRIVFLPDYDMSMARPLYPGCDVWMNNPLRPYEACGTSGMKAALNGAANLSIRDGWWDEWYDPAFGWEIPSAEDITDPAERDRHEADFLYNIMENEIAPKFYARDSAGLPMEWITMVRETISGLGPKVIASRMVRDYVTELYVPAAKSEAAVADQAEELAAWKHRIRQAWGSVVIERVESMTREAVEVGSPICFAAQIRLGSLRPEDVEVEVVAGEVDAEDELQDIRTYPVTDITDLGDGLRKYEYQRPAINPGTRGYTFRVVPKHPQLANIAEMGLAALPSEATS